MTKNNKQQSAASRTMSLFRIPHSASRTSERGFTLIELAIVLVIIGIILGAVLKGQDLITNAKAKQFVNKGHAWEVGSWSYMDRKGKFPGDGNKDGKIGDTSVKTDLIAASFINPPYEGAVGAETNTISMGSFTFYVFLGNDTGTCAATDTGKNILTLCKTATCATAFTADELTFLEAIDVSIDGSSDGTTGQVIGTAAAPGTITAANWTACYAAAPVAAAWSTTTQALVYYFDRKR